jgi:hypothetical protein
MGYLIIAIVVLVLLAKLLEIIAQVGLASFPAWSVGLIVGFIALHLSRKKWLRSLHLEEKLTTLVNLNFNGSRLECSINSEEIDKYPAGGPTIKEYKIKWRGNSNLRQSNPQILSY